MQQKADQMMACRVGAEKAPVQHVRKPGQRVPITQIGGGEGPFDALQMNAGLHDVIFGEISRIIKIDKMVARNPAENNKACDNQQ